MFSYEDKCQLALGWAQAGIFLDKTQSPNGIGFRLKLHETNPTAPLSPFYLNFRLLRSFPRLLRDTGRLFSSMMKDVECELLADIPTAATPLVTALALHRIMPIITPREKKTHGTGATIDGVYERGDRVALFDDLITSASSKLEAIQTLEAAGLSVTGIFVLVDREQGGAEELAKNGYKLHAAWKISELLNYYLDSGKIEKSMYEEIMQYLFPLPV